MLLRDVPVSVALLLLTACGDSSTANSNSDTGTGTGGSTGACMIGFDGCPCSEQGLCLSGLACVENLCFDPGDVTEGVPTGSASDSASAGTTQNDATTTPVTTVPSDPSTTASLSDTDSDTDTATDTASGSGTDTTSDPGTGPDTDSTAGPGCGDGVVADGEACDGADLAGGTCQGLGFQFGQLGCTPACAYDTSQCTDSAVCGDGVIVQNVMCYKPPAQFGDTLGLTTVILGDVSGDGHLDMVAGTPSKGTWIRLGNGDGSFAEQATQVMQPPEIDVQHLIDLDKDGDLDLVGGDNGTDKIHLLHNDGAGNLALAVSYDTLKASQRAAFADVDDDGWLDMTQCGYYDTNVVGVRRGQPGGLFGPLVTYPLGPKLGGQLCGFADFDLDGHPDLWTVAGGADPQFRVLHGDGGGNFSLDPATISFKAAYFADVADIDGDQHPDVVGSSGADMALVVRHGDDGGFLEAMQYSFPLEFSGVRGGTFGDFDGNAVLDVLIHTDYTVEAFRGDGTGLFYDSVTLVDDQFNVSLRDAAVGDLNEDGIDDIVTLEFMGQNTYFQRVVLSDP